MSIIFFSAGIQRNPTEVFMKGEKKFFSARNITYLAVLLALVIVLQVFSGYFKVGTTALSFVLVPIVLGGMILGVTGGAILGFAFGLVVIFDALGGLDPFTFLLLTASPASCVLTVILCIVKGTAAGVGSALIFKALYSKNKYIATFAASAAAPLLNTGIFVVGALCMGGTLNQTFAALGLDVTGYSVFYIVFVLCVGINFFVEFAINLICAPAIFIVDNAVGKRIRAARGAK